ncbi:MAG: 23S rRNA (guanosine(2251)-2'-O)-methyltransferase RlmB [Acholeplasmataceae bacterium]|nr:23S rRNA (guanosine(2251)-2'-O)-methyltransferase RlmB [Acholeplasmataceae bacterium]
MIVYGKNVIREIIYNQREIYKLYLDNKFKDFKFLKFLESKQINYETVAKDKLNELTNNALHQGVVADVKPYEYIQIENIVDANKKQNLIILDEISDPHNLGAILRTAEAAGIDAIVVATRNQVSLNATVAKVSSGAIEHVPVIQAANLIDLIKYLKNNKFIIVGTAGDANLEYNDLPKTQSIAVILGSEGEGMRSQIKQACDLLVKIPMYGKINSLNVSVAGALIMYEMIKK